ncbi:MAG: GAF domain-containing protein, partial [Anaerolineales bacterium]|nr:GAF domain-containing protein [Anaerolineales bacterium]
AKLNFFFESKSREITLIGANINTLLSRESLLNNGIYWDAAQSLTTLPNGSWDNSNAEPSSIFIPAKILTLNPGLISQINTLKLTETSIPSILKANPEIIAIYFGGSSGETIYYPNIDLASIVPPDFDVTQRPWYVAANPENNADRNVIWSDPYQDAALNGLVVTSSIPVFKTDTQFRGVAAMDIQLNSITDVISSIKVGESGYAFLIDHNKRLIAFPAAGYADFGLTPETLPLGEVMDATILPGMPASFFDILSKISAGESGFTSITFNDVNRYVIYRPLPEIGYGLAILVPQLELQADAITANEQIQQQTQNTILVSLILIFAILFAASIASLGMGNALTAPLITLTKTAKEIASGNFDTSVKINNQDEIGILGQALNTMTQELRKSFVTLEQGVAERTYELEISRSQSERRALELQAISEISKVIAGEQKLPVLLPLITRLVSERFGFYHTGIFLLDDTNKYAVLQAASSEGGKNMLARGHKLEIGESGIVGFVGKSGTPRIALDVGLDAVFFDNPDLPDTRSEMALPLIVRNKIVGVLDLQSKNPGAFTNVELNTMSILADQVAIAIENARLFQQTQQALTEAQALYRQNTQEGWRKFSQEEPSIGYHQTLTGGNKLFTPLETEEIRQVMNRGESMVFFGGKTSTEASIIIPIKLRGQVIGALKVKAPEQDRVWSRDEINLAETVSERLSLALENSRLIQESQGQAAKEQVISDIASKIGSSVQTENILRTTAAELSQLLNGADIFIDLKPNSKDGENSKPGFDPSSNGNGHSV